MNKRIFAVLTATMLTAAGMTSVNVSAKDITSKATKVAVVEAKKVTLAQEWKKNSTYEVGDVVTFEGKIYECTVAHSKLKPTTKYVWKCIGEQFEQWKPNTKYIIGDKVMYQGKVYECIVDHSKLKPTVKYVWKVIE